MGALNTNFVKFVKMAIFEFQIILNFNLIICTRFLLSNPLDYPSHLTLI